MAEAVKGKAPRPKHVPQRTCIACRRSDAKGGLVRLVRAAEGRIVIDLTGRHNGRGAYLCRNDACWEVALKRRALERALRLESMHPDDRGALLAFAAQLAAPVGADRDPQTSPQEAS